jgi:predicted RNase H-like nuclease
LSPRRGPDLPYSVVAGVTPSASKWLVASAKVQGSTFAPEPPKVYDTFMEVLDERPSFSSIVVNAPIGFRDTLEQGPRTCDVDARRLLGARGRFVHNAPMLPTVLRGISGADDHVDAITAHLLQVYAEVAKEMSPFRQRQVYEGHPELSFYFLNGEKPLLRSKKIYEGRDERETILIKKVPNIATVLNADLPPRIRRQNVLDAAALLASARRVFTRSAKRIPADAEWDSQGLRMELVY